jgi:IS30 family transposase
MFYTHLSSKERYVISHLVLYGLSLREISRRLQRHRAAISREIKRNRFNNSAKPKGLSFIRNPAKLVAGSTFIAHPNILI